MDYVVCGPPGSGKTTWVRERMRWGDVVVDVDALFAAVTGLPWYEKPDALVPLVLELAESAVAWMRTNSDRYVNGFVITGGATRRERERWASRVVVAELVMLAVPPDECLRRIAADPRRGTGTVEGWREIVERWWREYERVTNDE